MSAAILEESRIFNLALLPIQLLHATRLWWVSMLVDGISRSLHDGMTIDFGRNAATAYLLQQRNTRFSN
jgi:hypothetical protein